MNLGNESLTKYILFYNIFFTIKNEEKNNPN